MESAYSSFMLLFKNINYRKEFIDEIFSSKFLQFERALKNNDIDFFFNSGYYCNNDKFGEFDRMISCIPNELAKMGGLSIEDKLPIIKKAYEKAYEKIKDILNQNQQKILLEACKKIYIQEKKLDEKNINLDTSHDFSVFYNNVYFIASVIHDTLVCNYYVLENLIYDFMDNSEEFDFNINDIHKKAYACFVGVDNVEFIPGRYNSIKIKFGKDIHNYNRNFLLE